MFTESFTLVPAKASRSFVSMVTVSDPPLQCVLLRVMLGLSPGSVSGPAVTLNSSVQKVPGFCLKVKPHGGVQLE